MNKHYLYELTYELNAAAVEVHKFLGPGLLESTYQKCLTEEFRIRGIDFETELNIPIVYKEKVVDAYLRCDFLIEKSIVVETKAVTAFTPAHQAQLLTYYAIAEGAKGDSVQFPR